MKGRGGEELSTELSAALERCLLGGKSGAGTYTEEVAKYHTIQNADLTDNVFRTSMVCHS